MIVAIRGWVALVTALAVGSPHADAQEGSPGATVIARRVGDYVEQYLSVARRIVARESVTLQTLADNLSAVGPARRLEYETRVEWEPAADGAVPKATVYRTLLDLDGRAAFDSEQTGCLQPVSAEPLAFLLPGQRESYSFAIPAERGARRQGAAVLAFVPLAPGVPSLLWRGDCASLSLPGMLRGQLAYDPATFAVLRIEHHLIKPVRVPVAKAQRRDDWGESITIEQLDETITYKAVQFRQPDETLMLPVEIQRVTLVRTPAVKAVRVTQRFANHTRFVTDSRVVPIR
ncbi:MAG TPA: hypothetical protein VFV95_21145 [Vicinamibacterales bacterium]|nr:hypothetical protein [Vicinamibacterales bacterium]